jgi:hypothetical protein
MFSLKVLEIKNFIIILHIYIFLYAEKFIKFKKNKNDDFPRYYKQSKNKSNHLILSITYMNL